MIWLGFTPMLRRAGHHLTRGAGGDNSRVSQPDDAHRTSTSSEGECAVVSKSPDAPPMKGESWWVIRLSASSLSDVERQVGESLGKFSWVRPVSRHNALKPSSLPGQ
jgi:hypothetical protein